MQAVDDVLENMAVQLHAALIRQNLNPHNPPMHTRPPADLAYRTYLERGGHLQKDAESFIDSLIKRVGEL